LHKTTTEYLGILVIPQGLKMDSGIVGAIEQWPFPQQLCDVHAIIRFSIFYRRFIEGFAEIVHPLMALTKRDTSFVWLTACQRSFERLKKSFISNPILRPFDLERKIVVETDPTNLVVTGVLLQHDDYDILHPVTYFSRKHSPAEINYEIHDKELLTIVQTIKEWRPLLEGSPHTIEVIPNH
jgi:hypothetical protein